MRGHAQPVDRVGYARPKWSRTCPGTVAVRACEGGLKGNGLFARVAAKPGDTLLEEDPICGTAILMFNEKHAVEHCVHCTARLPSADTVGLQPAACPNACGALYCGKACFEEAWWAHHSVLCPAVNEAWAAFEKHARECSNEYYIVAARAVASLRHMEQPEHAALKDDVWQCTPFAEYSSRPWWETMRRPVYGSSRSGSGSGTGSVVGDTDDESAVNIVGMRGLLDVPSGMAAGANSANDGNYDCRDVRAHDSRTLASPAKGSGGTGVNGDDDDGQSTSSDQSGSAGSLSLDRFFVAKVQEQTRDTAELLLRALFHPVHGCRPSDGGMMRALLDGPMGLGRLVGLIRLNALAVLATRLSDEVDDDDSPIRGMALYAIQSVMNHAVEPNCFVASDPDVPQRCYVRAKRPVAIGDELCIDYLEGATYDCEEQHGILRFQYLIPQNSRT